MPLDPQVAAFLGQLEAVGAPPLSEVTPEEGRLNFAAMAALSLPAEQPAETQDRRIPGPDGDIAVRVYRPLSSEPCPLIVFFHGGGWVIGNVQTHDSTCQQLASRVPAVVVSVDYRLAPQHRFPAAVQDCVAATAWAHQHAVELGGDPDRMAVAGDSAGGNLAAVVAIKARDAGGPPIRFQLLIYPATDLTASFPSHEANGQGYLLTGDAIGWFLGHYIDEADRRHPDASPLFAGDLTQLPEALVITAEFDPLRDEGEAYADRLQQAGVVAKASRYDGMIHGFFQFDAIIDRGKEALDEAVAALRQALG